MPLISRGRGAVTIMDMTDSRQILSYISSTNQRQVIYDPAAKTYSPNYTTQPNTLIPELYLAGNSTSQIANAKSIKWSVQTNSIGNYEEITKSDATYVLESNKSLTIKTNVLADNLSMNYKAEITYPDPVSKLDIVIIADIELVKISNGSQGPVGSSAVIGVLSNEAQTIPTDSKGNNGNYFGAESDLMVYEGTKNVTTSWTVIATPSSGVVGNFTGGVYTVTNMTTDNGYVDFVGNRTGYAVVEKRFNLTKVKAGEKGVDGKTPIKGTDYFDGKDGQDGESSYLWIMYSQNADGSGMVSDSTNAKYVGVATTRTNNKPTNNNSYTWTLVKGGDGIPGEPGSDGRTSYLHVRYSDNGTSFTANNGQTMGTWIGTYVDFTETASTVFSKYSWSKVKGEDGDSATAYQLIVDKKAIKKDEKGVMTDGGKINISALSQTGTEAPKAYSGRLIIQEQATPGATWVTKYTSSANQASYTYTVTATAVNVKVNLYLAGATTSLIDTETITVVSDGATPVTLVSTTPKGTTIRNSEGSLTIKASLFKNGVEVTGTYKWYEMNPQGSGDADSGAGWNLLNTGYTGGTSGFTSDTLTVSSSAIKGANTYMVIATYEGIKYRSMETLIDITDPYSVQILGSTIFKNGKGTVTLTAKIYRNGVEIDPLGNSGYVYQWNHYYTATGKLNPNFSKVGKTVTINRTDVENRADIRCQVSD